MLRVTSSRRRPTALKPTDYDHEISLVDHDGGATPPSPMVSDGGTMGGAMLRSSTTSRLLPTNETNEEEDAQQTPSTRYDDTQTDDEHEAPPSTLQNGQNGQAELEPACSLPTPDVRQSVVKPKAQPERETAIDILYENERGGFLCGVALFSGAALGGLDPPPWTNGYHKASPTSTQTAQVPDPSWEWAWPEWRINHQEGVDEAGWEYSFHFSKRFSWHSGKWWNSFVRRRAWTRKRIKKRSEDISSDPHMLTADYFNLRPASQRTHRSQGSVASKTSMSQMSAVDDDEKRPDIEDIDTLMQVLRQSRIDREKSEAIEDYLEHARDLPQLQEEMHEIMSLFVFQVSRRTLLGRLMNIYDETTKGLETKDTTELKQRQQALKDAVKHADEEVRKLAYWSDVKQMAENGEAKGAVDSDKGWHDGWSGVETSGAAVPNNGNPPGK
ncbi:hypothetical protein G7046_g7449 [Stylonectria norvegica]|nr:hypothetical protein G7046_g7449 [Stylonectria norvegica]